MRLKHFKIACLNLFAFATYATAEPQVVCTVSSCQVAEIAIPEFAGAQNLTTAQVWELASEILAVSGLAPNFQVLESEDVPNAAAIVRRSERYLVFNPDWLARLSESATSKWEIYGVLAHEIGHHLQGHTLLGIGSRPPVELQADSYAGFALGALGASKDEALALWRGFSETGSATHPPRHQRLAAVERGWMRAAQRPGAQSEATVSEPDQRPLPVPSRMDERDRSADVSCMPVFTGLGQAVTCATSALKNAEHYIHAPSLLFDENPETAWIEDAARFGKGQTIAVDFLAPVDIRRILFQGASNNEPQSPRIKQVTVRTSSGFEGTITLADSPAEQFIPLPLGGVVWISFTIDDAYRSDGAQDLAIAEIGFE